MQEACKHCGQPCDAGQRFCVSCGRALDGSREEPAETENSAAEGSASLQETTSNAVEARPAVPYSRFAAGLLLMMIGVFITAFVLVNDLLHRKAQLFEATMLSPLMLAVGFLIAERSWSRIGSLSESDNTVLDNRRRLLWQGVIFSALFAVIGVCAGYAIAANGIEVSNYLRDLRQLRTLSERIAAARATTDDGSIDEKLATYETIEPDANTQKDLLQRALGETDAYNEKFSEPNKNLQTAKENLEAQSKQLDLLLQQIAVAKELRTLASDADKPTEWSKKMKPLIDAEDELAEKQGQNDQSQPAP